MDYIYIIIINIALGILLFTIFLTSLLNKKYRIPFLSSYVYFQIFLAIFGVYGILVPGIIRRVLINQEIPVSKVESIRHFFTFLGIPFLILAWYMFLRLCFELVGKRTTQRITLIYFLVYFLFFIGYGILIYLFEEINPDQYDKITDTIRYVIGGLGFLVLAGGVSILYLNLPQLREKPKQKRYRRFAHLNLLIFLIIISLLIFSDVHEYISLGFLFLLFGSSLVPLLYIRSYIIRSFPESVTSMDLIGGMGQFIEKYGISKREEEIIQKICEGKSNLEISDSLFITVQTVKDHIHRIFLKTGVRNRIQLSNLIQSFSGSKESRTGKH